MPTAPKPKRGKRKMRELLELARDAQLLDYKLGLRQIELRAIADETWRLIIIKPGKCARCGKTKNLHAAHIISRGHCNTHNLPLRYDLANGICMCVGCHIFWAHKEPIAFAEWLREKFKARYVYLVKRKDDIVGCIDYYETINRLKAHLSGQATSLSSSESHSRRLRKEPTSPVGKSLAHAESF